MSDISLNVREIAGRKKIKQKDVSERMDVSITTINSWFGGNSIPKADMIPALARALRVPIHVLFLPHEEVKNADNINRLVDVVGNEGNCARCEELESELKEERAKRMELYEKYTNLLEEIHGRNKKEVG